MRRWLSIILTVSILTSLAACGTSGDAYTPTGDGLSYEQEQTKPVQDSFEESTQKTLTLTYYPEKSLNPLESTDFTNRALLSLVYQGLFSVDRNYKLEPVLCERYSMSEDMLTYTFYVDPKATFADGSKVKAEDVEASLLAAQKSNYYGGRFLHVWSIALSEDGGVAITLDTPYENFPILLDIPIVKASQTEAPRPLGSGPYLFDASNRELCLRRRTDWWCQSDLIVTAPVIYLLEAESTTQIRDNFQFSDLTLVCANPGSDRYADYRCDFELWDCETGMFVYLAASESSYYFSDPQLRQALTYAIDRETLSQTYYRGFGVPTTLPVSPASPYYSQKLAERYEYAPERFSELVSQLTDPSVTLLVNSEDSLRLRMARSIADMLRETGMKVTTKELSGDSYLSALRNREYDLYLGQTKLSANMDLSAFFAPTGALSYGGLDDVAAYSLCLQALENQGNFLTLHQTVMENGLLCPILFYNHAIYATRGSLVKLTPARDNIFYYSIGKTMESAFIRN